MVKRLTRHLHLNEDSRKFRRKRGSFLTPPRPGGPAPCTNPCKPFYFRLRISLITASTAAYSTPATAQMIQLYLGCPLPLGPKV